MQLQGYIEKIAIGLHEKKDTLDITFRFPYSDIDKQHAIGFTEKFLDVSFNVHREKRSLDANSYFWVLIGKLQQRLQNGSTKDEIYLMLLERFGAYTYLPVPSDSIDDAKAVFRIVKDRGVSTLISQSGKQIEVHTLQCWKGSSCYNTKEMSVLIDGVVRECQDYGIDTCTPEELKRMKEQWGIDIG